MSPYDNISAWRQVQTSLRPNFLTRSNDALILVSGEGNVLFFKSGFYLFT